MQRILTQEQRQYIIDNCKKMDNIDLAKNINEIWGTDYTNTDIGYKKKYIKKRFGINTDCPQSLNKSIIQKGNVPFNKGLTWNDYMSEDKQENCRKILNYIGKTINHNAQPIGSERLKLKDNGKRYYYVKTDRDKWEAKHRLIWEEVNGKIPNDKMIIFLDGNSENVCLENLALVSKQEELFLNRHDMISEEPEITKVGITLAKLQKAIKKREKNDK